mmetsp:Transcript_120664/g.346661  ORF Transcript_120664/g.346661 Transcript_120664/m.346661 type:complete len:130 (+) Transcript_120664:498-887(+)
MSRHQGFVAQSVFHTQAAPLATGTRPGACPGPSAGLWVVAARDGDAVKVEGADDEVEGEGARLGAGTDGAGVGAVVGAGASALPRPRTSTSAQFRNSSPPQPLGGVPRFCEAPAWDVFACNSDLLQPPQ